MNDDWHNRMNFGTGTTGKSGGRSTWNEAGPGGQCVCPTCKLAVRHERGKPCSALKCPVCGTGMIWAGTKVS